MARIAGIQTQKNTKGIVTHVTVDIRKHPQAIPLFKELGAIAPSDDDRARARVSRNTYMSESDVRKGLSEIIRNHPIWKK